jgi:polysaccharide deacetylase 2 family uncharacterized protein YibQ
MRALARCEIPMAKTKPKTNAHRHKTSPRPRGRKASAQSAASPLKRYLPRILIGLTVLVGLVVIAAVAARHYIPSKSQRVAVAPPVAKTPTPVKPKPAKPTPAKPRPAAQPKVPKTPTYEIFPTEDHRTPKPPITRPAPPPTDLPRVALIIDDIGYDQGIAAKFMALDNAITFSILPFSPFQQAVSREMRARGMEALLHLPMEPKEFPDIQPGRGALLVSMTPDELIRQLEKNLDAVPDIKGVNNHMGSRMTERSTQMYQIFSTLKKRGLFFIDSRTTSESLCRPSARLLQVPYAQRDVFLDHVTDETEIRRQIQRLVTLARRQGSAIGIGHPHLATYTVLAEQLPMLKKNVKLVPASRLVQIGG